MRIDIITLFPKMFKGPFEESIIKRARQKGLVEIKIHNLRDWTKDKHKTVDDRPYGGGTGMVLMVKPIYKALTELKKPSKLKDDRLSNKKDFCRVILLTPQGNVFNQKKAKQLAKMDHLVFICGHYEGVDQRVADYLVDEEISIGDYILTGGELPAMVIADAIIRLIPEVLGKETAIKLESFMKITLRQPHQRYHTTKYGRKCTKLGLLLEYSQYTRPINFRGWRVPEVLFSGDHKKIAEWRAKKALEITKKKRPDLLKGTV